MDQIIMVDTENLELESIQTNGMTRGVSDKYSGEFREEIIKNMEANLKSPSDSIYAFIMTDSLDSSSYLIGGNFEFKSFKHSHIKFVYNGSFGLDPESLDTKVWSDVSELEFGTASVNIASNNIDKSSLLAFKHCPHDKIIRFSCIYLLNLDQGNQLVNSKQEINLFKILKLCQNLTEMTLMVKKNNTKRRVAFRGLNQERRDKICDAIISCDDFMQFHALADQIEIS